jgi:predicted nucleic acid-binding Zn ribbon protein
VSADPREPRRCIKCGREIGPDESICEVCNRAGMATPSASQYHGTVVVAIVAAVAGLALAASLSLRGVGPYAATVTGVGPTEPAGYAVTFTVTNQGTRSGRAKCQLIAVGPSGERLATKSVVTAPVAGGAHLSVTERVPGLDVEPADVTADCT